MSSQLTRKQIIASIVSLLVLVAVLVFSLSRGGSGSDPNELTAEEQELLRRANSSQQSNNGIPSANQNSTTTTQVLDNSIRPQPYNAAAQAEFLSLPTTGEILSGDVANYVSPRYEAILGGDPSSPIPLTELDNAANSDLPKAIFDLARTSAIDVTSAELTGQGTEKWPQYFDGQPKGRCYNFRVNAAGATKLPLAQNSNWIITYVSYSVTCPTPSGPSSLGQLVNVYFENINGKLTPKLLSQVPRN